MKITQNNGFTHFCDAVFFGDNAEKQQVTKSCAPIVKRLEKTILTVVTVFLCLFSDLNFYARAEYVVTREEVPAGPAPKENHKVSQRIFFSVNSTVVNPNHLRNKGKLSEFTKMLSALNTDESVSDLHISIRGNSSVEGPEEINEKYAETRARAAAQYISTVCGIDSSIINFLPLPPAKYEANKALSQFKDPVPGVDLEGIKKAVNTVEGRRLKRFIQSLDAEHKSWKWFEENILNLTRFSDVTIYVFYKTAPKIEQRLLDGRINTTILFGINSKAVDSEYRYNSSVLSNLSSDLYDLYLDENVTDIRITLDGKASLEGPEALNLLNAAQRASATSEYLVRNFKFDESKITQNSSLSTKEETLEMIDNYERPLPGVDFDGIREAVNNSSSTELKQAILALDPNGASWNWFAKTILDYSRACDITITYKRTVDIETYEEMTVPSELAPVEAEEEQQPEPVVEEPAVDEPVVEEEPAEEQQPVAEVEEPVSEEVSEEKPRAEESEKPQEKSKSEKQENKSKKRSDEEDDNKEPAKHVERINTNLLYDVATVANLGLEFGFAGNCSINLAATYSPWSLQETLKARTLLFQPEFRVYFAKGFRGHYLGLEGHYGWYNIALADKTRYQDRDGSNPLWGAGLTYGYVLPISKHFGFDFSLGAGYTNLDYDCFYNVKNGAKFTSDKRGFFGPTKLGISFYYQF